MKANIFKLGTKIEESAILWIYIVNAEVTVLCIATETFWDLGQLKTE